MTDNRVIWAMRVIPAVGASIGGLSWIIKASMILATGNQPPLLWEIAPIFFAIALYGLLVYAVDPMGSLLIMAKAGIALVIAAGVVGVALGSDGLEGGALLGVLILLVGLGFPLMRRRRWDGAWRFLPVALGLGLIPAFAIGGLLEAAFGERYLELPLVVVGAGWVLLGYRLRPVAPE
jgi:hypothetical protein